MRTTKAKRFLVTLFIGSQLLLVLYMMRKPDTSKGLRADIHNKQPMDSGAKNKHQFSINGKRDKLEYSQRNNESSAEAGDEHQFNNTASRQANETSIRCSKGYFQLNNDGICHPWLTCEDIQNNVTVIKLIFRGSVKKAYLARWKEYRVVFENKTTNNYPGWLERCARALQQFQPSPRVTQLLGYCPSMPAFVTEYYRFGSLRNVNQILKENQKDNIATRFRLSLDYVQLIHFFHTNPNGTYVICDNKPDQFLLTSDFKIVVNDLDKIHMVNSSYKLKQCSNNNTRAAPEERLPSNRGKRVLDEKTDIWKIPQVANYLLGDSSDGSVVKSHLSKLHQQCLSIDPKLRPTANEILKRYLDVQQILHF